jgi:uncharacterized membrane protein
MSDPRFPRILFCLLLIMGLLQLAHFYPLLPARVASHFDAYGTPNGWAPKEGFFVLSIIILLVPSVVLFAGPNLAKTRHPQHINLPNKAYWLAPERVAETQRFFRSQMSWFACGVLFVLLYGTTAAMKANLPAGHFDSTNMYRVIAGFIAFSVIWCIYFIRRFYRIPPNVPSPLNHK